MHRPPTLSTWVTGGAFTPFTHQGVLLLCTGPDKLHSYYSINIKLDLIPVRLLLLVCPGPRTCAPHDVWW